MATRIEKIYKTNSLILLNDLLNLTQTNLEATSKMSKRESEFCINLVQSIDKFFKKNGVTDEELRRAINEK